MKLRITLAAILALGALKPLATKADDLFQLYWRVNVYQTNRAGQIIRYQINEQNFVNTVAQNNNLNPADLVFVYRPNKHDTAVVRRSNGAFVADVIQMEYNYTDVTNPRQTVLVRHALLYDEAHDVPLGSFFGTETRQYNSNGTIANDALVGTVIYSKPDENRILVGQVSTGRRINDSSGG